MQSTISFKRKLIIHDYRHGIKILQYSTVVNQDRHQCTGTVDYMQLQGGPIKTAHFFEIPYFCSHNRYNHAVFAQVFRNYSRKQQATIFLNEC